MDQLHTANKVCGGCCAISLSTVDTESSVSPITLGRTMREVKRATQDTFFKISYSFELVELSTNDFEQFSLHLIRVFFG